MNFVNEFSQRSTKAAFSEFLVRSGEPRFRPVESSESKKIERKKFVSLSHVIRAKIQYWKDLIK